LGPAFATEGVREIVGIVGDTHNAGLGHPPDPVMIVPVAQVPDPYAAAYNDFSRSSGRCARAAIHTRLFPQ
jgi:hypothetical protein